MRLLGDYGPGSGSDAWNRRQIEQSSVTDGESTRAVGWTVLGRGRTPLGFRALRTRESPKPRAGSRARLGSDQNGTSRLFAGSKPGSGDFEDSGSVGIRVPAVPDTDFGTNVEAVTANPKHQNHLAAAYPPNPLYPSGFSEYGGHRPFWPKSRWPLSPKNLRPSRHGRCCGGGGWCNVFTAFP